MAKHQLLMGIILSLLLGIGCQTGANGDGPDSLAGIVDSVHAEEVGSVVDVRRQDDTRRTPRGQDASPEELVPDLPLPPSPWLRPWRCTAVVTTTSENSRGTNELDEFGLTVTESLDGTLSTHIDHYLYKACDMTWQVDAEIGVLLPLECSDDQFQPNQYDFTAGSMAVQGDSLTLETTGSKVHGRSGQFHTMTMTVSCVGCPFEPCGLMCEWGTCCGGQDEPCCQGKDKCAGDMECLDGACTSDIPCPSNFCQDSGFGAGFHCDGDTQRRCTTMNSGCYSEVLFDTQDCGPGGCDPATGTCGACDVNDPCFGAPSNVKLCDGAGHGLTCGHGRFLPGGSQLSGRKLRLGAAPQVRSQHLRRPHYQRR